MQKYLFITGLLFLCFFSACTSHLLYQPLKTSCEDQDIRVGLISAEVLKEEAEIYISVKELAGDRFDETIDLFDSYKVSAPSSCSYSCRLISFDEEQKEAVLLIRLTPWKRSIVRNKVTFSLNKILSRKDTYDAAIPELVLSDISDKPPELLEDPQFRAFTGTAVPENDPVMVPFTEPIISPVPGVQITAMGFLDDKLHIQTHFDNILEYDNHGFVYLTDADGTQISSVGSISFWDASHSGSYEEFLFDIPRRTNFLYCFRVFCHL